MSGREPDTPFKVSNRETQSEVSHTHGTDTRNKYFYTYIVRPEHPNSHSTMTGAS